VRRTTGQLRLPDISPKSEKSAVFQMEDLPLQDQSRPPSRPSKFYDPVRDNDFENGSHVSGSKPQGLAHSKSMNDQPSFIHPSCAQANLGGQALGQNDQEQLVNEVQSVFITATGPWLAI
jgi:hypothetical protein